MAVSSEQVAAFLPIITRIAYQHKNWNGAEMDDLIQEGLIAVWASLEKDIQPSQNFIANRMKNWIRLLGDHWSYESFEEAWDNGVHNPGS